MTVKEAKDKLNAAKIRWRGACREYDEASKQVLQAGLDYDTTLANAIVRDRAATGA